MLTSSLADDVPEDTGRPVIDDIAPALSASNSADTMVGRGAAHDTASRTPTPRSATFSMPPVSRSSSNGNSHARSSLSLARQTSSNRTPLSPTSTPLISPHDMERRLNAGDSPDPERESESLNLLDDVKSQSTNTIGSGGTHDGASADHVSIQIEPESGTGTSSNSTADSIGQQSTPSDRSSSEVADAQGEVEHASEQADGDQEGHGGGLLGPLYALFACMRHLPQAVSRARSSIIQFCSMLFVTAFLLATPAYRVGVVFMSIMALFLVFRICLFAYLLSRERRMAQAPGGDPAARNRRRSGRGSRNRVRFRLEDIGRRRRRRRREWDLDDWGMNPTHMRLSMRQGDFTANDYETLLRLDEEVNARAFRGIPQSLIERYPSYRVDSDVVKQCSICLEMPEMGDKIRTIPCLHAFHAKCIDKWLRTKPTCPVCNFDMRVS